MSHLLLSYWPILAILAVLFGTNDDSPAPDIDDWQEEWAAHPMNKEGMNWKGN